MYILCKTARAGGNFRNTMKSSFVVVRVSIRNTPVKITASLNEHFVANTSFYGTIT